MNEEQLKEYLKALEGDLATHPARAGSKWYTDRERAVEAARVSIDRMKGARRARAELN